MRIGVAGPIDINLLRDLFPPTTELPNTYSFPFTAHLARELYHREHEIVLFALSREVATTHRIDGNRITAYVCPLRRPRRQMLDFFRGERHGLRDAMRASMCDVIHAHWTYEFGSAAVESGLPCVVTAHDIPTTVLRFARHPYWLVKPWLALRVLRIAQCVTAVSPYLAQQLERFLRPQKDIVVVPNGVGPEVFALANRHATRKGGGTVTFASVLNGLGPLKNAKALIKAFSLVVDELGGSVELWMLGSGFEKGGPAERWATRHHADSGIRFIGPVPHAEVLRILADEVDVLVHPSLEETFCMAALEAMAIGVPVIGGRGSGAIPWLLERGKQGQLVDVSSPLDLAEAMTGFSRAPDFAIQRAGLARTAAREKFSISSVVDRYERLCQAQIR